jgi:hypothetical protein
MKYYLYDGPVMEFGRCVAHNWKACTYAASDEKAFSNLAYQFNKARRKAPNAKIALPGKLDAVGEWRT